jgi:tRNA 2-thiouridine synthesizing protein A
MNETRLDLRGLKCPLPAMKTRKALAKVEPGTVLIVECTDPLASIDLPNLARETGDALESHVAGNGYSEFRIRKRSA